jgi:hypothetical protein
MSELSVLFHFTSSKDNLFGILKNEFKLNYSLEEVKYAKKTSRFAIPMVCFCDIPLSQIKSHIDTYGHYGIGLSKKWAVRKGLNPIIYLKKDSFLSKSLSETKSIVSDLLYERLWENDIHGDTDFSSLADALNKCLSYRYLFGYIKNYEGKFFKDKKHAKAVTFYNEREWRYVPKIIDGFTSDTPLDEQMKALILGEEAYSSQSGRESLISRLKPLGFEPGDIKYLIVRNEDELNWIIDVVKKVKSPKYPPRVIEVLTSRILTSDQIKHDF